MAPQYFVEDKDVGPPATLVGGSVLASDQPSVTTLTNCLQLLSFLPGVCCSVPAC